MSDYDAVAFCGELKRETDGAFLVFDGANEIWIPRSQIKAMNQIGNNPCDFEIKIPQWLAKSKGII